MAEATWHGRHIGRFLGIEPTGKTIVQPFIVILSFRDGLMLGERFHYDLASLLRQIGADPIPALRDLQFRQAGQVAAAAQNSCVIRSEITADRKSTRLNSSHSGESRMPSSA